MKLTPSNSPRSHYGRNFEILSKNCEALFHFKQVKYDSELIFWLEMAKSGPFLKVFLLE
jgi:hypothetical protein